MKGLNKRFFNSYQIINNQMFLIIKNQGKFAIDMCDQVHLKKEKWSTVNGKPCTLINLKLETMTDYLLKVYNESPYVNPKIYLPKVEVVEVKSIKLKKKHLSLYFDNCNKSWIVTFKKNNKKVKRYFSIKKYGDDAKDKAVSKYNFVNKVL